MSVSERDDTTPDGCGPPMGGAGRSDMTITCFALESAGSVRLEDETAALARWRAGAGPYWIHMDGGSGTDAAAWLTARGFEAALVEGLQLGSDDTTIQRLTDSLFFAYPFVAEEHASAPARFACLCVDRLVITVRERPVGAPPVDDDLISRITLRDATPAGVVCALAVGHAARLRRFVARLRAKGNLLAARMEPDSESVSLDEILALKHLVLTLGSVVDEELAVLDVLKVSKHPALPLSSLADSFHAAVEGMQAADRGIDRLDLHVSDLQRRYEFAQQDRLNRRLGLLTVLSAIFMPLTLIVGIEGMNFDVMPELHYHYSYPIALGVMALIAGGEYWYFRSRFWLK